MAKAKKDEEKQIDLFPVTPEIRGLGICGFKLKDGIVEATLVGSTMVGDVALLNDHTWRKAVAEWLVALCGNGENVQPYVDEARAKALEIQRDLEIARMADEARERSNVRSIGSAALSGLA